MIDNPTPPYRVCTRCGQRCVPEMTACGRCGLPFEKTTVISVNPAAGNKKMTIWGAILFAVALYGIRCLMANTLPVPKTVDIPALINQPPEQAEKQLGQPVQIGPITDRPELMPGEVRQYSVPGDKGFCLAVYKEGRLVNITIELTDAASTEYQLLHRVGIPGMPSSSQESGRGPEGITWKGVDIGPTIASEVYVGYHDGWRFVNIKTIDY